MEKLGKGSWNLDIVNVHEPTINSIKIVSKNKHGDIIS